MAVPLRRDVLWLTLAGGSDLDSDLPGDRAFSVGGPDSFPGFEQGELRVDGYWLASTSYLWRVKDLLLDPESCALYRHRPDGWRGLRSPRRWR